MQVSPASRSVDELLHCMLSESVDRCPLFRPYSRPKIGKPYTVLLTCKRLYDCGIPYFWRRVYVDIAYCLQGYQKVKNSATRDAQNITSIFPAAPFFVDDAKKRQSYVRRLVLFGDSDLANDGKLFGQKSTNYIAFLDIFPVLKELSSNLRPVRGLGKCWRYKQARSSSN